MFGIAYRDRRRRMSAKPDARCQCRSGGRDSRAMALVPLKKHRPRLDGPGRDAYIATGYSVTAT
jgi:hypothetical protein